MSRPVHPRPRKTYDSVTGKTRKECETCRDCEPRCLPLPVLLLHFSLPDSLPTPLITLPLFAFLLLRQRAFPRRRPSPCEVSQPISHKHPGVLLCVYTLSPTLRRSHSAPQPYPRQRTRATPARCQTSRRNPISGCGPH